MNEVRDEALTERYRQGTSSLFEENCHGAFKG